MLFSNTPNIPLDAIIFDCDSTLSRVEGITVLAQAKNVFEPVDQLTEKAMAETGISEALYQARLDLVKPGKEDIKLLGKTYWDHVIPDASLIISVLHKLGKAVYVVSAGVKQAVVPFAIKLGIPEDRVFAVELYFDSRDDYENFDRNSPLIKPFGKPKIVDHLRQYHKGIAHIGDGMNDVEVAGIVDRFIGYGGVQYRESIASRCDFYITCLSLSPILPLLLTRKEASTLQGEDKVLFEAGIKYIAEKKVEIREVQ